MAKIHCFPPQKYPELKYFHISPHHVSGKYGMIYPVNPVRKDIIFSVLLLKTFTKLLCFEHSDIPPNAPPPPPRRGGARREIEE